METSCRICPLRPQRGRCHFADSLSGQIVGKPSLTRIREGLPVNRPEYPTRTDTAWIGRPVASRTLQYEGVQTSAQSRELV
jgi:hypothetical protein